jgi:subfamily B ATP-binding cassette protein HlyB/CyaB
LAEEGVAGSQAPLDSGLAAFVVLLRFLGKPADAAQLRHEFSPDGENFTADHILRAAKRLEVKARRERCSPERLEKAALPAIALMKDGSFALLAVLSCWASVVL